MQLLKNCKAYDSPSYLCILTESDHIQRLFHSSFPVYPYNNVVCIGYVSIAVTAVLIL